MGCDVNVLEGRVSVFSVCQRGGNKRNTLSKEDRHRLLVTITKKVHSLLEEHRNLTLPAHSYNSAAISVPSVLWVPCGSPVLVDLGSCAVRDGSVAWYETESLVSLSWS